MLSLILIIIVSLIPFIVTWITSPEEIFLRNNEQKQRSIFRKSVGKRISTKGKWFIATFIFTGILAFIQYRQNEKGKKALEYEKDLRDSIITAKINYGVDSNRKILYKDLSEALAKQNLQFDSAQNKIVSLLKDSAKTVILNSPREIPIIIIRENGITHLIKNDTTQFKVSLISKQAACNLLFINYLCEFQHKDGSITSTESYKIVSEQITLPKDEIMTLSFEALNTGDIISMNIALIGKYTQIETNKEIQLKNVLRYSLISNKSNLIEGEEKILFLKKYALIK